MNQSATIQPEWAAKVQEILVMKQRTRVWLASKLGMNASQLTHMLLGDPRYHLRASLRYRIAEILVVPEQMIFGEVETIEAGKEAPDGEL